MEQILISAADLSSENDQLENELTRATRQIRAIARVSQRLSDTLLLEDVLKTVLQETINNTEAAGGRIALLDGRNGSFHVQLTEGNVVPTPEFDARVISERAGLIVHHLRSRPSSQIRSVLISPIIFEGGVAGLIHLFSEEPAEFDEDALVFTSALSNHAAVAIGNAQRFAELNERNALLQQRTQQIEHFLESSRVFHSDRRLDEVYEELVYAIQEGVGYNVVLLSLVEQEGHRYWLRRITAAGVPLGRLQDLQQTRRSWHIIEQLLQPEFRLGGAYFVPAGEAHDLTSQLAVHHVMDLYPALPVGNSGLRADNVWHNEDLFFIPLRDSQAKPLGVISLAAPIEGKRPDLNTARVLEVFANQAASAIENVQLFHSMWDFALQLQQLHNVSQQSLREPDFDRKLQLILDGLEIAGWRRVTLTLRDEEFNVTKLVSAGLTEDEQQFLQGHLLPASVWQQRFEDESFQQYRRGNCYFIPGDDPWNRSNFDTVLPHPAMKHDEMGPWPEGAVLYRPLYDPNQKPIGMLSLAQPESGRMPDENALQTIDLYAQFAISVIENYKLFREMQQRSQELQTLFEASRALAGTLDEISILTAMGEHMLEAVAASAYTIFGLKADEQELAVLQSCSQSADVPAPVPGTTMALEALALSQQVIETGRPATYKIKGNGDTGKTSSIYSVALLPLPLRDELFGLVQVIANGNQRFWNEDKLQLLGAIVNQATTALETAHLVEELDDRVAQRTRALAEEVAKIQSILESIADGVLVTEADGTIIVANVTAARILDMSRELLVGKTAHQLMGLYGDEADIWAQTIKEWARVANQLEPHTSFRTQLDIGDRVVSIHVSPVFANSNYFGTISIFRDITKEVEVDRMKSEFVSTVSHELRTPMTSIKGYVDLMLLGVAGQLSPPQLRFLEVIKKNADRLKTLVDDILDISRIETGKTELKLQPVDVSQIINEVFNEHLRGRIQHEQREIDVRITIAPSLPLVKADPEKITRVLMNLVDNALNYTPDGGEIEIGAENKDSFVFISIRDTGIGITKENQTKIFERFFRVEDEEVQEIPGTGLGLSIVRSLVEMHGGKMNLESEFGAGSTFTFSLPCVDEDGNLV